MVDQQRADAASAVRGRHSDLRQRQVGVVEPGNLQLSGTNDPSVVDGNEGFAHRSGIATAKCHGELGQSRDRGMVAPVGLRLVECLVIVAQCSVVEDVDRLNAHSGQLPRADSTTLASRSATCRA